MEISTATPESVKRTMEGMVAPFIMVIETDNGYLGDYDSTYQMGNLLIELGEKMRRNGLRSSLITDKNGTGIGRYDWH